MDELGRWLWEDFGLEVAEVAPVTHGADVAAEVWRVRARGAWYAVKWSGGGTDAGPLTVAYLVEAGVQGVPEQVRAVGGGWWSWRQTKGFREPRRLTVQKWVDGVRAAEVGLTGQQWSGYGRLLRQVHEVKPSVELRGALPATSPVYARMPGLVRQLRTRFASAVDQLEEELAAVWREHAEVIETLVQRAHQQPPGGDAVICHADPHLGNVIANADQLHLIDWDDAVLAPVEQDLMFMLGGMGQLGPITQEQLDAFLAGYGDVHLDESRLKYYRNARALEDVALWSEQVLNGPDRQEALEILKGVLGPGGLAQVAVG